MPDTHILRTFHAETKLRTYLMMCSLFFSLFVFKFIPAATPLYYLTYRYALVSNWLLDEAAHLEQILLIAIAYAQTEPVIAGMPRAEPPEVPHHCIERALPIRRHT